MWFISILAEFSTDTIIVHLSLQGLHPRLVTEGFELAKKKALEVSIVSFQKISFPPPTIDGLSDRPPSLRGISYPEGSCIPPPPWQDSCQNSNQESWLALGRNLGQNLGSNLGKNLERNLGKNVGRDLGRNLGKNLSRNLGKNLGQNLGMNLCKNLSRNIGKNLGRDRGRNLGKNFCRNLGKNLGRDLGRNLGKNLGMNLQESWHKS